MNYEDYVQKKLSRVPPTGIPHGAYMPGHGLFPHQCALVSWACKRGRAAIFADTGLGKSRMQLAWAEAVRLHTGRPVLILATLAVAPQTVAETLLGMGLAADPRFAGWVAGQPETMA